jgi:hypothetical protein
MLKLSGLQFSALSIASAVVFPFLMNSKAIAVELVGRAVLPADTYAPGPTTGQLLTGSTNGRTVPFTNKQPVQAFCAVVPGPKPGTFLVMVDDGYGSKAKSPDFVPRIYAVQPDFPTGKVFPVNIRTGERIDSFTSSSFIQLNDGANKLNFPIVAEQTIYPGSTTATNPKGMPVDATIKSGRWLTGGDFDLEAFQQASDGTFWLGDEFGPFLLHVDANGQVLEAPIPLPNFLGLDDQSTIQSPDNPAFASLPTDEERIAAANLGRNDGIEGLALNGSGTKLYTMFEGNLVPDPQRDRLLIHEFDLATKKYTGQVFFYRRESSDNGVGSLSAINDKEFLVIERDEGHGAPNNPAFPNPAHFKRIYKIDISKLDKNGFVEKELLVDLLNIPDPKRIGGDGTTNGVFTFPFHAIDHVLPINDQTLMVVNDNMYQFKNGRNPSQPDGSEFILIELDRPLALASSLNPSSPNNYSVGRSIPK